MTNGIRPGDLVYTVEWDGGYYPAVHGVESITIGRKGIRYSLENAGTVYSEDYGRSWFRDASEAERTARMWDMEGGS